MTEVSFETQELQQDGSFRLASYQFKGDEYQGWHILRNGDAHLQLGPGYVLLETLCCGICSTDLARCFLPFPLPQVTGHEVVALQDGQKVVIEINASHKARGIDDPHCSYCAREMDSHCPDRLTLGINRLPGGFSPYLLAPMQAIHPLPPEISIAAASFTEPFAAALQALSATPPQNGDVVAVLGPRRLGMLLLAALSCVRQQSGRDFKIVAIIRHPELMNTCMVLGADEVVDLTETKEADLNQAFDIVYDTTGSLGGFELALKSARRFVHLKSTHGQACMGIEDLTALVVDEIALLPFSFENLNYGWPNEKQKRDNLHVLVSDRVPFALQAQIERDHPKLSFHVRDLKGEGQKILRELNELKTALFPHFDLAIVSELQEVDLILRPVSDHMQSALRPRGAILLAPSDYKNVDTPLSLAINQRKIEVHSSRCGNFEQALTLLQNHPKLAQAFEKELITHRYPLADLSEAFQMAADSKQSIKVLVETSAV